MKTCKIIPAAPSQQTWKIIPAAPSHIPHLAANMREADRREVWASHRHTPLEALRGSLARSELAWTCLVDNRPALMCGAARTGSLLSATGVPWLLGTNDILKVRTAFLRQSRHYVDKMQQRFPRLENYVHAQNRLSIRWLRWCGFSVADEPVFINNENFFLFWRGEDV